MHQSVSSQHSSVNNNITNTDYGPNWLLYHDVGLWLWRTNAMGNHSNYHSVIPIPMPLFPFPFPFPRYIQHHSHSHRNPMGPVGSQSFPFPCTSLVCTSHTVLIRLRDGVAFHGYNRSVVLTFTWWCGCTTDLLVIVSILKLLWNVVTW